MATEVQSSGYGRGAVILELTVNEDGYEFGQYITRALSEAEAEMAEIEESLITLKDLTPKCDKLDYALAAASGALCGIVDVFLVGKPGESPIGEICDRWFDERVKDFAKACGWGGGDGSVVSAMRYLSERFHVPYDQNGTGEATKVVYDLNLRNHRFKSLAHNPTLLGLFFSILDQFNNTSHFVSKGELISIQQADGKFELHGNNVVSKLFCGVANWLGHLISDAAGSENSRGRGMGMPSPIWSWTNDVIAIKRTLNIAPSEFDIAMNELALEIYKKGFDARFQTAQAIPVLLNELVVRLFYCLRRAVLYFASTVRQNRSQADMWRACEPFSNPTVKRMLTVAHGSFCLVDIGDATMRGFAAGAGAFNVVEFAMRLNVVGVGRFVVCLYGEVSDVFRRGEAQEDIWVLQRRKDVVQYYIEGLKALADLYDDRELLAFVDDLTRSDAYKAAFEKTVRLAEKRRVPEERILRTKDDIDEYFMGGGSRG